LAGIAAIHARRFLVRQPVQKQIVDQTEDRGVETDPERERRDSNESESRRFAELSQRETEFVHDCSQLERFFIILFAGRRSDRHAWRGVQASGTRARRRWPKPQW